MPWRKAREKFWPAPRPPADRATLHPLHIRVKRTADVLAATILKPPVQLRTSADGKLGAKDRLAILRLGTGGEFLARDRQLGFRYRDRLPLGQCAGGHL